MTDSIILRNGQPLAVGCLVDGHWGIYGRSRMAEIAYALGYIPSEIAVAMLDRAHMHQCAHPDTNLFDQVARLYCQTLDPSDPFDMYEHLEWYWDKVELWLNDQCPDGYWVDWYDGELFCQTDQWWEEET